MALTEKDISEFKKLYKEHYGEELNDFVAYEAANRLVQMIKAVYKPITKEQYDKIEKEREVVPEEKKIDYVKHLVEDAKITEIKNEIGEKKFWDLVREANAMNKNMKRVIIIHGCPSDAEKAMNPETRTYDKHWIPWTKGKLTEKGIKVEAPLMPSPWEPNYERFKAEFEKYEVNDGTILIGHSCGCAFLVRWLGETKQKVAKLILVAPWKINDEGDKFREAFYTYDIDESIKDRVKEITMFTADDEEDDGKRSLDIYHRVLGGKIVELKGHGHYTMRDMGTTEFPELIEVAIS